MAGLALVFTSLGSQTLPTRALQFQETVGNFKHFGSSPTVLTGPRYSLAKWDTHSSLHKGATFDPQTGSWLVAVGAVLRDTAHPDSSLATLLTDYLAVGEQTLATLDGHFALVLYHAPADKLIVLPDPMGFISIFYGEAQGYVYVATSALAVARAIQSPPDDYGVGHYLNIGSMYGPVTLWQGVARLTPGDLLEITATGVQKRTYWRPALDENITRLSLPDTQAYVTDLFGRLIRQALPQEPFWADLTGGFDSRLVTMLLAQYGLPFTASCQGPADSPDVRISQQIAQGLGWRYQHMILPEDWGVQRCAYFQRALTQGDGHLDVFKLSSVLWDQEQRARQFPFSVWGLGGEVWRGTIWKQEFWNVGRQAVNYDRLLSYRVLTPVPQAIFSDPNYRARVRAEVRAHLQRIGDEFSDYPNTVQLDRIFTYKTTGHSGAHISAVLGLQRVLAPLYFKESVTAALSTRFQWRQHSRLVRRLLAQGNLPLAAFPTTDGGPALPIRWDNLGQFKYYWLALGKQLVRKASQTLLGRSLLPPPRDEFAGYPLARWRRETLDALSTTSLLQWAQWHSARLYNREQWEAFFDAARADDFRQEVFLSRLLTVEMALRLVDVGFE